MTQASRVGQFISLSMGEETVKAYLPPDLPPDPPLIIDARLFVLIEKANQALGRLDGATLLLPDVALFIYMFIRKEALLSSQIEGTQSSFSDLVLYENENMPGVPVEDVQEVSNYVSAMQYGLKRLQEGFPLSLRLIKEIHEILLSKGRGKHKSPGEFRRSQNWIGGSRPGNALFVPPPPQHVMSCMGALEKFLHNDPVSTPPLIKAALAHVQFETIHPFLDGNGRIGRLLITLLLCVEGVLKQPSLYLSLYFKKHRQTYYELLQEVREKGDWEKWLAFFLEGVYEVSTQAVNTIQRISQLFAEDREKITAASKRVSASVIKAHGIFQQKPILNINKLSAEMDSTIPTTMKAVKELVACGILKELTGRKRDQLFVYSKYIQIMKEGAEPFE